MYFYNSHHQCLKSCLYDASEQYYSPKTTYRQSCKSTNENKFYYANKTIMSSCSPNFISGSGSFLCVENCGSKKFMKIIVLVIVPQKHHIMMVIIVLIFVEVNMLYYSKMNV